MHSVFALCLSEFCSFRAVLSFEAHAQQMDRIGPRWSDDELFRFYERFRSEGRNWEQVSSDLDLFEVHLVVVRYPIGAKRCGAATIWSPPH